MADIIQAENLIFDYSRPGSEETETVRALDGVSLSIEEGSFTAIIGRNGSGKSTLAKNLNGLYLPSSGRVLVNGWDTADDDRIWDIRQTCGMVFQNPDNQLVASIVEDDVAFGPENLGIPSAEIRARVERVLRQVGMADYREKTAHLLSGGQKQRVAIAGVIAMEPRCILFDEPMAMLDPQGRAEIMEIIRALHRAGHTVVLITHFMDDAAGADRVVLMDQSRIVLDGEPREVFQEEEIIRAAMLEPPLAVRLAARLRARGVELPPDIITTERLVDCLCRLR